MTRTRHASRSFRGCCICGCTPRRERDVGGYVLCTTCRERIVAAGKRLLRDECAQLGVREASLLRPYARVPSIIAARRRIVASLRDEHRAPWKLIGSVLGISHATVIALYRRAKA